MHQIIKYMKIRILSSHRNSLLPSFIPISAYQNCSPPQTFRPYPVFYFHSPRQLDKIKIILDP